MGNINVLYIILMYTIGIVVIKTLFNNNVLSSEGRNTSGIIALSWLGLVYVIISKVFEKMSLALCYIFIINILIYNVMLYLSQLIDQETISYCSLIILYIEVYIIAFYPMKRKSELYIDSDILISDSELFICKNKLVRLHYNLKVYFEFRRNTLLIKSVSYIKVGEDEERSEAINRVIQIQKKRDYDNYTNVIYDKSKYGLLYYNVVLDILLKNIEFDIHFANHFKIASADFINKHIEDEFLFLMEKEFRKNDNFYKSLDEIVTISKKYRAVLLEKYKNCNIFDIKMYRRNHSDLACSGKLERTLPGSKKHCNYCVEKIKFFSTFIFSKKYIIIIC